MKKNRFRVLSLLTASVLMLSGCGTPMHELTDEEEQIIAQTAAAYIAKYNACQLDGMNFMELDEDTKENIAQSIKEEPEESSEVIPDKESVDQEADATQSTAQSSLESISLREAIKAEDTVTVKYEGYNLDSSYQEGGYYSIDAGSGKVFVIMNFSIKNSGDESVKLDAISAAPAFSACLDGSKDVKAETTFLTYSLPTIQQTLKAGTSVDVVMLFKVTKDVADNISNPTLKVKLDGKMYSINL